METVVVGVVLAVLGVAALLAVGRMIAGPSVLDRAVASEVLVAVLVCALGLEAAVTRHTTTLPILVSLALVGFISSVAVARFVPSEAPGGGASSAAAEPLSASAPSESFESTEGDR